MGPTGAVSQEERWLGGLQAAPGDKDSVPWTSLGPVHSECMFTLSPFAAAVKVIDKWRRRMSLRALGWSSSHSPRVSELLPLALLSHEQPDSVFIMPLLKPLMRKYVYPQLSFRRQDVIWITCLIFLPTKCHFFFSSSFPKAALDSVGNANADML